MIEHKRGAGILMHITSLPSSFGIGDLGGEAYAFADFLHRCKQQYWQLLPLNPTEQGQGHSPYSSISSKAGNTLIISPELLVEEGLLKHEDLQRYYLPKESMVDFANAEQIKTDLFDIAWNNFHSEKKHPFLHDFQSFCRKEAYWIDDFALYMLLKQKNECKPWFEWPEEYKMRDKKALHQIVSEHTDQVEKVKWLQFIFSKQWHRLKDYCNNLGISLFGDLPFYVSYDSVDVWADREIFSLDKNGNMIGAAGVPPDAFSSDGQLWGMPVFRWDVLKKHHYSWWVERLRKNIELYDLIRLDHFRAFADYWEVPADERTAKNGKWVTGPGADLFRTVQKELGRLPFVAEDLGEIDEPVYKLRDEFEFPGMKILQFAFGHEMPQSPHIPHNYTRHFVAYTGTHDNNTIVGWYWQDGKHYHYQLEQYIGKQLYESELHWNMARLVFASVAAIAILPMQDVLGLHEHGRMNTPASGKNNWKWRMLPGEVSYETENRLKEMTVLFNRG